MKAISSLIGTVLLIAFTVGMGGVVSVFFTGAAQTSTGIISNTSGVLTSCSAAIINGNVSSSLTWTSGKFGNALQFDGVPDHVNVTNSSLSRTAGSVSMWVYPLSLPSTSDHQYLWDSRGIASTNNASWSYWDSAVDNLRMGVKGASLSYQLKSINAWHHIVGTYDTSTATAVLYVDGVEVDKESTTDSTPIEVLGPVLFIGMRSSREWSFNGTIDEVRIYNRALSASEVKQHYESGITELFGNRSVVKFQLHNNGQYSLGRNFNFLLSTSSASNVSAITLNNDLSAGGIQPVTLSNLTLSTLSVSSVQTIHVSSLTCSNVLLTIKELRMDC
ncbi:MAG: LamG domain-containing protein [Candidatus Aenigmarchaeota archaeon]|nr:LamG domain-containing protein [Candidatus Aenigmarchaeota archaeon]